MVKEFNKQATDEATPAGRPPPPKLDMELQTVLHRHKGHWPRMFPRDPFEAADLWEAMQEPPKDRERPEWIPLGTKTDPHAGSWQTPYIDRLRYNLRVFLSHTPNDQAFIAEMIRAGYPWRGDKLDFYREVIKNTDIMYGYVDKYGRTADGLLPEEYTKMILKEVGKLTTAWTGNLPYDKNERIEQ